MSDQRLSQQARLMRPSALREMLSAGSPPRLSLAGGLPPAAAFPFDRLGDIAAALLSGHDVRALQYTAAEGDMTLRAQVAEMISSAHGRSVPAARVLVTTGSQQGIDLVARVLLDPGDVAVVESPCYVGALRALVPTGADVVGIRCDDDGMDTDALERLLVGGLRPKLCYLCANFSNPSGATLTSQRRLHLASLSEQYGFVIVEDDQYGKLRFRGEHLAPIASVADDVVYLSGFSKMIAPGLRVGYLSAPEWLVRPLVLAKQASDLAASSLGQRMISVLLEQPDLWHQHLGHVRSVYAARAEALEVAVAQRLDGRVRLGGIEGGMFVWAHLVDPRISATALIGHCRARGLALVPGSEFDPDGSRSTTFDHGLRLSFSTLEPHQFCEAVDVMAAAFDDLDRDLS